MKKKLFVGLVVFCVVGSLMTSAFAIKGHEIEPRLESVDPIYLSL